MVGEDLRTKGRNPMDSSNIKGREVAMNRAYRERGRYTRREKKKKKKNRE